MASGPRPSSSTTVTTATCTSARKASRSAGVIARDMIHRLALPQCGVMETVAVVLINLFELAHRETWVGSAAVRADATTVARHHPPRPGRPGAGEPDHRALISGGHWTSPAGSAAGRLWPPRPGASTTEALADLI